MKSAGQSGRRALGAVLLVALAVRIVPALCERQIGRDIEEYGAIAASLRAGRGFTNPIKAYQQIPTPVIHYGGYERAPLVPALRAPLDAALGPDRATQWLGPALWLVTLAMAFGFARARFGEGAALWAGLLLALHPGLLEVSLLPLSEVAALAAFAFALWALARLESPVLAGIGCALAFLARPSAALCGAVIGGEYLLRARAERDWRPVGLFLCAALIGPLALLALNHSEGAPLLQTPQNFLYRVVNFKHQLRFFHAGEVYPSTFALWRSHGPELVRLIGKNALNYGSAMADAAQGLGALVPILALAAAGLAWSGRLRAAWPLLAVGAADLALYSLTWATFDATRFLAFPYFAFVLAAGIGGWLALEGLERATADPPARRLAPLVFLPILVFWGGSDLFRSYTALRESQTGHPYSKNLETLWFGPDARLMAADLAESLKRAPEGGEAVVGSNDPWMIHHWTGHPALMIPCDLRPEEWTPFIERNGASRVALHENDWPTEYRANLDELRKALEAAGWKLAARRGPLDLWEAPVGRP